jgi:predicted transcriptional regulator
MKRQTLDRVMVNLKLTPLELSKSSGVHWSTIRAAIRGGQISYESAILISRAVKVPLDKLEISFVTKKLTPKTGTMPGLVKK